MTRSRKNRSNVDDIYEEYPFLRAIIARTKIKTAQVKASNSMDVDHPEVVVYWDGRYTYKFYLLDEKGKRVGRVGEALKVFTRDENIGQALARMGDDARLVRYGVFLGDNGHLILYKFPAQVQSRPSSIEIWEESKRKSRRANLILRLAFWAGVLLALFAALNALDIPSPWKSDDPSFVWAYVIAPAVLAVVAFVLDRKILPSYFWGENPWA